MDWERLERLLHTLIDSAGPILVGIGTIMMAKKKSKSGDASNDSDKD